LYAAQSESAMAGFYAKVVAGILCCVIILPAGWLILLTRRSLIEPIQTLVEATRRIGQGRLDHQVHLPGRDELSQLAQQVNEMASRLSDHQERLMRSRELAAIGEICAGVAHGMRNPLAGIRTSAQVLSRRLTDLPEEQQRIAELIREIDRLEARIASLLDFARPTTLNRRSVSVGSLVDAAIRDTKSTLRETGAEVTASDTTRDVQIDVDVDQMTQVLAELFSNAIEHMPGGGRITVTATSSRHNGNPNGTTLSVSDTGTGIRPNGLAHVFDLFFTTRPGGTGVGLAGAKRVVEAHGGRISVSSEPEAGTTVHIRF
jgi:signal transduction histidine kinase